MRLSIIDFGLLIYFILFQKIEICFDLYFVCWLGRGDGYVMEALNTIETWQSFLNRMVEQLLPEKMITPWTLPTCLGIALGIFFASCLLLRDWWLARRAKRRAERVAYSPVPQQSSL